MTSSAESPTLRRKGLSRLFLCASVVFIASAMCAQSAGPGPRVTSPAATKPAGPSPRAISPPATQPAIKTSPQSAKPLPVGGAPPPPTKSEPKVIQTGSGPTFDLRFKFKPGDVEYLTIEDDFRDSGGVQPLLTYTSTIKERRVIVQKVLPPSTQPAGAPGLSNIEWYCDRYEAREKAMKEEVVFDSLRHLYPPPSMYLLGAIPESTCKFQLDTLGHATGINIAPAKMAGQPGRGTPSKTIERCQLTPENLKKLLDDLGPNFLPPQPVAVGAAWTQTSVEYQRNVGTVTTVVKGTLREIKEVEGDKTARIELSAEFSLVPEKPPPAPVAATRPGQPAAAQNKPHEFKIDRSVYSGDVEFNVTRGELRQLNLRREFGVAAELEAQSMGPMTLKTALAQNLKVTVANAPPPKPVIVGGKKPPVIPKDEGPAISGPLANMKQSSQPASSQPAQSRAAPSTEKKPGAPIAPQSTPFPRSGPSLPGKLKTPGSGQNAEQTQPRPNLRTATSRPVTTRPGTK